MKPVFISGNQYKIDYLSRVLGLELDVESCNKLRDIAGLRDFLAGIA